MKTKLLKAPAFLAGTLAMFAGTALAQAHMPCSKMTLYGSFGYTSTGTLLASYAPPPYAGPFAEVGIQTFDGVGKTTLTATLSANGNITQQTPFAGTYMVNPDCTGSMTLISPIFGVVHADFVIDHHGTEIRAISTDSGVIESRVYRRQFRD